MTHEEALATIRRVLVADMVSDLVSVQPIAPTVIKDLIDASKSEEWLRENGYKPVSSIGLVYVKQPEAGETK